MLIVEVILITKDMGVLLICNHPQSQDASIQTDVSKSRVISVMTSLVGRDRGYSHWDQEEKVWGRRRLVVQQGGGILALRELS